ncbi:uncharacterized protein LOC124291831 [Haliotis rubra]|uniref:uncharacterized protein LOC124291831 n=1 Tax=Haliotis rubra TaxID=36100 RepID=UPI001EE60F50|nr:uncharacterized protein LOC124291831 [Haliotis rubra]
MTCKIAPVDSKVKQEDPSMGKLWMSTEAEHPDYTWWEVCGKVCTDPCTLKCDHTFCRTCLTQYLQSRQDVIQSKTFSCPHCRQASIVPDPARPTEEWVEQFATSHMKPPADCLPVVSDSKDVPAGTTINVRSTRNKCGEHSNRAMEFHCKDCTKTVCPVCCILYHRKCESVVTLQSMIPEMRNTLQENSQILSAKITDIHSKVSANRDIYTQMQQGITGLQAEITSYCQLTRELIREKEDVMMQGLDKRTKEQRETLQDLIKTGESEERMHKQQVEFIQRTLESEGTMDLYEVYQTCLSGEILATSVEDYAITEAEPGLAVNVKAELENIRIVLNESLFLCSGPDNTGSVTSTITKDMEGKDGRGCTDAVDESDDIDGKLQTEQELESDRQGLQLDIDEQIETDSKPNFRKGPAADLHEGPRTNNDEGDTDMEKYARCELVWSMSADEPNSPHMAIMYTRSKSPKLQESRKRHNSAPQLNNGSHTTVKARPDGEESLEVGSHPGGMFDIQEEGDVVTPGTIFTETLSLKSETVYQSAPDLTTKLHTGTDYSLYPETERSCSSGHRNQLTWNGDPSPTNFEQVSQLELKRDFTPVTVSEQTENQGLEGQESDSFKSKILLPHDNDSVLEESFTQSVLMLKVDKEKGEGHEESDEDLPEDTKTDTQETVRLDVEDVSGNLQECQRSETERAYNFDSDSLPVYHDTIHTVNSLDIVVLSLEHGFVYAVTNAMESAVKCIYRTSKKKCENTLRISKLPWAVAKMSNDMVAVTVPRARQIVLANVDPELQLHSVIRTHKSYYGLAVLEESMFVAGNTSDSCIDILALSGKVIRTIYNSSVKCPNFICPTPKQGFIVSDRQTKTVICFTATGEVNFTYSSKEKAFKENRGIATSDSGHVLVADAEADKIVLLTEKGEYVRDVLTFKDDIRKPVGLYLHGAFLYVTQWQNRIKVFKFT